MAEDILQNFIEKKSSKALEYIEIIEEMMGQYNEYGYAESTLLGILSYIEDNETITDAQIEAVENIREKPSRGYGR